MRHENRCSYHLVRARTWRVEGLGSWKKVAVAIDSTSADRGDGGRGSPKSGHRREIGSFPTDGAALERTISFPSFGRAEKRCSAARSAPDDPGEKSQSRCRGHFAYYPTRRHALEHPYDGQGARVEPNGSPAYLGATRPQTPADQNFQAQW